MITINLYNDPPIEIESSSPASLLQTHPFDHIDLLTSPEPLRRLGISGDRGEGVFQPHRLVSSLNTT
jgi:hypothetical protein